MRSRTRSAAAWRWRFRAALAIAVPAAAAGLLLGPAGPAHAAGPLLYVPDTNTDTVSVVDASTSEASAVRMYSHTLLGSIEATVCAMSPKPSPRSSTDSVNG